MKRALFLATLAACHGGGPKSHRTGSGAPVELVTEVKPLDAGRAGSTDEVEPNDADEVATPLPLGGTLRGKIEPEIDVDHVRLDIEKPGVLQVMLSGVDGQDLVLEVEDSGGSVIARSDRGGARTKEGIPNLGVTAGRYTLVVREAPKKKKVTRRGRAPEPPPPPAAVYELTAQLVTPPKGQEIEPDDDRGEKGDRRQHEQARHVVTEYAHETSAGTAWRRRPRGPCSMQGGSAGSARSSTPRTKLGRAHERPVKLR